MRYFILIGFLTFLNFSAQNVGIGTKNPEKPLHVDSRKNNPQVPSSDAAYYYDDVVISEKGYLGIGTKDPVTRVDVRSKDDDNAIAFGNTSQTAANAGPGAIRYNGNNIEYSDGTTWNILPVSIPNAFVLASKASGQSVNDNTTTTITNWAESKDFTESFDPATGNFSANKDGRYLVTFNFEFQTAILGTNAYVEAIINSNRTNNNIQTFKCISSYPGSSNSNIPASGACSAIFNLKQNDIVNVQIKNATGGSKAISSDPAKTTLTIFGI
ncbi:hypothetical protein [uncultured Chryseobacterium sp.]|uniref:hypothetical protein n=1 Tax=uncultured Chryseobacterium sp. TaxID=259322 RepID=UPI0025D231CD|nr:hypothetical protein [uncultured Chryseobacterium sp.]